MINNRDSNFALNNGDYHFFHSRAALGWDVSQQSTHRRLGLLLSTARLPAQQQTLAAAVTSVWDLCSCDALVQPQR